LKKIGFPVSCPRSSRRPLRLAFFFLFSLSLVLASAAFLLPTPAVEASKGVQKKRQPTGRRASTARTRKGASAVPSDAKSRKRAAGQINEPSIGDQEDGDEREVINPRQQWFMMQRAYPFDAPPAEGRLKAWLTRPKDAGRGKEGDSDTRSLAQTWRSIGPSPTTPAFPNNWGVTSGRLNAVAVHPTAPNIILIGASTGGIWRSTDGGANFVPVTDTHVDLAVGSIAFSKSNPSVVYAGMGDLDNGYFGTGVLKSTDAGATWARVSNGTLPSLATTAEIEVDPTNPNRVYILQATYTGTTSYNDPTPTNNSLFRSGFFLSEDGGVNWRRTLAGRPRDIAIHPSNPQILYVGMTLVDPLGVIPAGAAGIYKSLDGGASWLPAPTFTATSGASTSDVRIAVTPAAPERLYVISGTRTAVRVDISDNGGLTWTNKPTTGIDPGQFGYNAYLYVHPSDANTIYVGTRDIYKSTNDGDSWEGVTKNFSGTNFAYSPFNSNTHPDQHAFAFAPNDPNTIYVGNDGGISKSTNGGATFTSLNASLTLTQFVGISMHPTDPAISYGGTQDNGTQRRIVGTNTWREFSSGDGGRSVVNAANPDMVFTTYIYGRVNRFTNNGLNFSATIANNSTFGEPSTGQRIAFYPPMVGNGVDKTIYFGTYRLFTCAACDTATNDSPANWTAPAGTADLTKGTGDVLSAIGVERAAYSGAQVIYTGSARGRVMVSQDGGMNWTDRTAGLPDRFVESITVHPANPATAIITYGGFGTGHVFRTTDFGASWTNIGGTPGQATAIPNVPVSAFLIDPTTPGTLYAGSDIGVFRSTDNGATWATFNNGLLPAVVTGFATSAGGVIQLSTYGRGAYELTNSATYTISGSIRNAIATPFNGLTVTLSGAQSATTTTDAQGNYSFANLPTGTYTVTPSGANYVFEPGSRTFTNLSANQTANFLVSFAQYSISGRIMDANGHPMQSVAVNLSGSTNASTSTDANGNYLFNGLTAGGNYTVTPVKTNYTFTPQNATISNLSGNRAGVNFSGAVTCTYSATPVSTQSFTASGGTGSFNITTQAGCPWSAISLMPSWLTITNGSGTGNGTVTYTVAANFGGARNGQILHTDDSFYNITQAASAAPAAFDFSVATAGFGEAAARATINVTRTGNTSGAASVDYRTIDTDTFTVGCFDTTGNQGGAYGRCDFATTVGTLFYAAGETSKTINVPLIDDGHAEGAETFQLRLSNPSGAVLGSTNVATITIQDNDAPGAPNPITTSHPFFVRQQYLDFLSREPDTNGFNAWVGLLNGCANPFTGPNVPSGCDRIYVSGEGFFRSLEFQLKGFYVFRFYQLAFNRLPEYTELVSDMSFVAGQTAEEVYARKAQLATLITQRQEFQTTYGAMTNALYVNTLLGRYGVTQVTTPDPAQPDGNVKVTLTAADLTNRLNANTLTRAQVLRAVADSDVVGSREFNNAFVGMQYYGYLRRKPDTEGFRSWLGILQSGNVRTMVDGFLNSNEYRLRFGR
jgi:hypothetical protein